MKYGLRTLLIILGIFSLFNTTTRVKGFALLGPIQPWMQNSNGVIFPGDIGGPMNIGEGYRWNVPVLTYGFDQSFLDYFGTNGITAVKSAIQILNDLPPASQNSPTNYPYDALQINYLANSQNLIDLKSATLAALVQRLGLGSPTRSMFVLKSLPPYFNASTPSSELQAYNWPDGTMPGYVLERNFDPQTLSPSFYLNEYLYSAFVSLQNNLNNIIVFPADPFGSQHMAVADGYTYNRGSFFSGLTFDDMGGLCYLYSTNNVNDELLPPGVIGIGTNANSFAHEAARQGVDKLTFIAQPVDGNGNFLPYTNYFTDRYVSNFTIISQQLARIVLQPDFIFTATNLAFINSAPFNEKITGATNWVIAPTLAYLGTPGPGVIYPPFNISFVKFGQNFYGSSLSSDGQVYSDSVVWASYDNSTNAPVVYPIQQNSAESMNLLLNFHKSSQAMSQVLNASSPAYAIFTLQTSTNLINWETLFSVTNTGGLTTLDIQMADQARYYQLMPQ